MRSGHLDLSRIEILVLDEADRMLDMGFLPDIKRILAKLPAKRQNLLFSATFSDPIRELASRLLDRPELIEVAPRNSTAENVDQCFYRVERDLKPALLAQLIQHGSWSQVLVFTRTKHGADRLARRLQRDGITTAAIHGNKSQNARTRALDDLKQNRVRVLVATDIAARGLDIQGLPHVVNFDMPHVPEDYVHRIGRTARAGASGQAVSLVGSEERKLLRDIERLLGAAVREERLEGFASAGAPSGFRGGERASETPRSPASRHRSAAVPPPHVVDGAAPARTEVRSEGERTGPAPGRLRPARRRRSLAGAR
jgi:ATP-dependent RNA helicase RhlE